MVNKIMSICGWLIVFVVLFLGIFGMIERSWFVIVTIVFGLLLALGGGGQTGRIVYLVETPARFGVFSSKKRAEEILKPNESVRTAVLDEMIER
jgi:hypothetical protein